MIGFVQRGALPCIILFCFFFSFLFVYKTLKLAEVKCQQHRLDHNDHIIIMMIIMIIIIIRRRRRMII